MFFNSNAFRKGMTLKRRHHRIKPPIGQILGFHPEEQIRAIPSNAFNKVTIQIHVIARYNQFVSYLGFSPRSSRPGTREAPPNRSQTYVVTATFPLSKRLHVMGKFPSSVLHNHTLCVKSSSIDWISPLSKAN